MENTNDALTKLLNQLIESEASKIGDEISDMGALPPEIKRRIWEQVTARIEEIRSEKETSQPPHEATDRGFLPKNDIIDLGTIDRADTLENARLALEAVLQAATKRYKKRVDELTDMPHKD